MTGIILIAICIVINLLGVSHSHFVIALFLLGVGWNFMFIAATQMVSETYTSEEKFKAQACNEFIVFSMVAVSALAAGWLEEIIGWQALNLYSLFPLSIMAIALLHYQYRVKPTRHDGLANQEQAKANQ